ncbi:MAG TPA: GNAT family N-acetyltransferase [Alphaproteobacteria bacterium]|nr:GNAT family N-acetyltransferase [Alphaproteobacteria bacterium]
MTIRIVDIDDISEVARLEKSIEGRNAASLDTLMDRFSMFQKGFRVAEYNGKICGYIESCRWNKESFETFEEIRNFPDFHDENGRNLYIIFLAVDEKYRKQGIGSSLVKSLQYYAQNNGISKIQLASKKGLEGFYGDLGFEIVKDLPLFLYETVNRTKILKPSTLMEFRI